MPRRRFPIRIPLLIAVAAVVAAALTYIFGLATLQAWGSSNRVSTLLIPRLIDVVLFMWCFWVGSSVGSFLNVVAWRMPRNQSINGRSHCPRCEAQLKARDNFPVFGWLALGGRCRTCRLPISARYPIVEAVVGTTLTLVAMGELYRLCLPYRYVHWHGGPFWTPIVDKPLLVTMLYHVIALATSWAFGLIRLDGHRLPSKLLVFAVVAVALPMIVIPQLMIVPWQLLTPSSDLILKSLRLNAVARVLTSIVAAIFLARVLARGLCPAADPKLDPLGRSTARLIDLIAILAIPIIVVGWHASPAVVVLAALIAYGIQNWIPKSCDALGRFAIAMPIAMTMQILFWRSPKPFWFFPTEGRAAWFWPSEISSPWVILSWGALLLLVPFWLREKPQPVGSVQPKADIADEESEANESEDLDDTNESSVTYDDADEE